MPVTNSSVMHRHKFYPHDSRGPSKTHDINGNDECQMLYQSLQMIKSKISENGERKKVGRELSSLQDVTGLWWTVTSLPASQPTTFPLD